MLAVTFYQVVLAVHVMAVVVAFGVIFAYPVMWAAARRGGAAQQATFHRTQEQVGKFVISPGLVVVIAAGAYLATDRELWSEVWVTVPLVIAIVLGGLGGAYFSPKERQLAEMAEAGGGPGYDRLVGQVKLVQYVASALVLVAIFFMVTKLGG